MCRKMLGQRQRHVLTNRCKIMQATTMHVSALSLLAAANAFCTNHVSIEDAHITIEWPENDLAFARINAFI